MLRLQVTGLMLEKLATRAMEEGARFSKMTRTSPREMLFEADAYSAKILQTLSERYSLPCRLVGRSGLDALGHFLRARWTLSAGVLLFCALLYLFSSRIWMIDVSFVGERAPLFSEGEILDLLAASGVYPGMAAGNLDTTLLQMHLEAASGDLSFVGVRRRGAQLLVEVAPVVEAPELFELDRARDLVSVADGVVVSVNALSGEPCVKPGDVVRRGDTLIRGEEMETKESTRGVAALGEVIVRTWITAEGEIPLTQTVREPTGRENTSAQLRLMDSWSIDLISGEAYALSEDVVEHLPVGGLFLPLEIVRTTTHELHQRRIPVSEDVARAQITKQLFVEIDLSIARFGADVRQIVDKWIDYSMIEGELLHARAVTEVHRQVAVTRDALLKGG